MPFEPPSERRRQLVVAGMSGPEVTVKPLACPRRYPLNLASRSEQHKATVERLDAFPHLCQLDTARSKGDGVSIALVQVWAKDIQHEAIALGKIYGTAIELHRCYPARAARQALGDAVLGADLSEVFAVESEPM